MKYDKIVGNETLLESTLNNGMVKEREDMIAVMKKVDLKRYPDPKEQEDADVRIKRQVKKAVAPSVGLRDCLKSVAEKFPWSSTKVKFMTTLSFFIQCILGTAFYVLDVYTDIKFSAEMVGNSKKNFGAEMTKCMYIFEGVLDQAIEDCKMQFNKQACMSSIAELKFTSDECFQNEQRFTDNTDWRIAGGVCAAHCIIPFLVSFILWEVIQRGVECCKRTWTKLPIAFVTKWHKYRLEKKLYKNYGWADRNKSPETEEEFEKKKKEYKDEIQTHENVVVLSLVVESSLEASFQVSHITKTPHLYVSKNNLSLSFSSKLSTSCPP